MAGHLGDRARSWIAAVLQRLGLHRAAGVPAAGVADAGVAAASGPDACVPDVGAVVSAEAGGSSELDAAADLDFAPVTPESLRRVLDGLRQLN